MTTPDQSACRPFPPETNGGMTLLEVMAAMVIITLGLLTLGFLQTAALRGNTFARHLTCATAMGQTCMEELMASPYSSLKSGGPVAQGIHSLSWSADPLENSTDCRILRVTVTWPEHGENKSIELRSIKRR